MTPDRSAQHGYAKGRAKRAEIIEKTLEIIGRQGFRGTSIRELAKAAGTTQAGIVYHFGSKEELFTEVLRRRDDLDVVTLLADVDRTEPLFGLQTLLSHALEKNSSVPGLVHLYAQLSVDAADPAHPAHSFYADRSVMLRDVFVPAIRSAQADGLLNADVDPGTVARIFQAMLDGLAVQWLQDPTIDMTAVTQSFFALILAPVHVEPGCW